MHQFGRVCLTTHGVAQGKVGVMNRRSTPLQQGTWTPRERVHVLYLIAANARKLPNASRHAAAIRRLLRAEECQPERP